MSNEYEVIYQQELAKRSDTMGAFKGSHTEALVAVVNAVFINASNICLQSQTGHKNSGPDAARRNCAELLKQQALPKGK